jgi:polyphosphate kinase 2 (PPK2 family)
MDYRKHLIVRPGRAFRLNDVNPADTGAHESQSDSKAKPEIHRYVTRMEELQYLLYADGKQSLLVVLQGLDAAGKDGVIRHVFSGPQ